MHPLRGLLVVVCILSVVLVVPTMAWAQQYECPDPACRAPVDTSMSQCPNCLAPLDWSFLGQGAPEGSEWATPGEGEGATGGTAEGPPPTDTQAVESSLFLEDAYLRAPGQFGARVSYDYYQGNRLPGATFEDLFIHSHSLDVDLEFGLAENLQAHMGLPLYRRLAINAKGPGAEIDEDWDDLPFGVRIGLAKDGPDSAATALGFDIWAPVGDDNEFFGRDRITLVPSLAVSKRLGRLTWHNNLVFRYTRDARPGVVTRLADRDALALAGKKGSVEGRDLKDLAVGVGLEYGTSDTVGLIGEIWVEHTNWGSNWYSFDSMGGVDYQNTRALFIPGIALHLSPNMSLSGGVPIRLTKDAEDWGITTRIHVAF